MDLVGDERAQSVQVGAVLLFAVLIVAFSSYQAFVVPQQNEEIEFNHNQQVQRDMIEVRNTLLETYTGGSDGYAEVTLGTNFPARLVAVNPAPPSGSLRTTEARPIVIEEQDGTDITDQVCPGTTVETRFLEYEPNYAVYGGAGTLRYESSFLYHDFGDESVSLTDQTLVEGDRVQIIPITSQFSTAGSRTVSLEPKAGLLDTTERSDIRVKLPTRLSEREWESRLDGEVAPGDIAVTTGAGGRNVTLTLDGTRTIECGPVGIGETPPSGARGGSANEINPAAPGDITLVDETTSGGTTTLTFNNTGGTNNITEARINFYESTGRGESPSEADLFARGTLRATLGVGDPFTTLSAKIQLDGGGTNTQVELRWDKNPSANDWFILSIKLETGETGLYFIPTS